MKYNACMKYIIDVPDAEFDDVTKAVKEIADDAQWFIDEYAMESYCSMVERPGEDE